MADTGYTVHQAVYQRLKGGLSVPAHDAVPDDAPLPYVTLDTSAYVTADGLTARGEDGFVYLTVWSEQLGQAEVLRIIGEIDALMNRAVLTLATGSLVSIRVEQKSTQRDADNRTFMGSVTLRVMTTH